jgi:hypothetical protein
MVAQSAGVVDVEDEIKKELEELRNDDTTLFTSIKMDTQCRKSEKHCLERIDNGTVLMTIKQ